VTDSERKLLANLDPANGEPPTLSPSLAATATLPAERADLRLAASFDFLAPPEALGELGRLGGYRVVGVLGQGGMGAVFEAEDPQLGRRVALKVMLPQYAGNPVAKARFLREARAQAAVEHDHIVAIHQVGEDRSTPFIAMPLLQGQSLADALRGHPRPPIAELVRIGREIAEGLAAAHEAGLVHRDIKPGNVWLEGKRRRVKILDFGLARAGATTREVAEGFDPITASGAVVGTPSYMSPEQAGGRTVDARTDLFSLGVVLYLLGTGKLPFQGSDMFSILTALAIEVPPAPSSVNPGLPGSLNELIVRLLSKDPAGRPPTAEAAAHELHRIEESLSRTLDGGSNSGTGGDPWAEIETQATGSVVAPVASLPPVRKGVAARLWIAIGLVVLLGASVLVWRGIEIFTPKGTLVVDSSDSDAEVIVKKSGTIVVERTKGREFSLKAGDDYTIELADPNGNLKLSTEKFAIEKDRKEVVKVRAEKPKAVAKPKELPDPDRKAAEALGSFADLTVKLASGGTVVLKKGMLLPREKFVVTAVDVDSETCPSDVTADKIVDSVAQLGELNEFRIRGSKIACTESTVDRFSRTPAANSLQSLNARFELSDFVLASLKRFPKLKYLGCAASSIDDALLERLVEFAANFDQLALDYFGAGGRLTKKGLDATGKLNVKFLALASSPLVDRDLIRRLTANIALNYLNVVNTKFDDDCLSEFIDKVDLKRIDLDGTKVTDRGLESLAKFPRLIRISLNGSKVTEAGVKKLSAASPQCRIEWDGPTFEPGNPDRLAAEKLLAHVGSLTLRMADGRFEKVTPVGKLPAEAFTLIKIDFENSVNYPDKHPAKFVAETFLPALAGCESIDSITDIHTQTIWTINDLNTLGQLPCRRSLKDLQVRNLKLSPGAIRTLSQFPSLTSLFVTALQANDAMLIQLAKELPNLSTLGMQEFTASTSGELTSAGIEALVRLPLNRLILSGGKVTAEPAVAQAIAKQSSIESLDFATGKVGDAALIHYAMLPRLKNLSLYGTSITDAGLKSLHGKRSLLSLKVVKTQVTEAGVKAFAAATPWCRVESDFGTFEPTIKLDPDRVAVAYTLTLGGVVRVNGSDRDLRTAAELPKEPYRLTYVDLDDNPKVTDAGLQNFRDCKYLTDLYLFNAAIGDEGLANFQDCTTLRTLHLGGTRVTDRGLAAFKNCKNLRDLHLYNTTVGDEGLAHFNGCSKLVLLGLNGTKVSDRGLVPFQGCQDLAKLLLEHTAVTDDGVLPFQACKNLTLIKLAKTKVKPSLIDELHKALPKCRIEWDGEAVGPKE